MCKSFNVGRAAENGLVAALLARAGFTSSEHAIEAPRGFANVFLPGSDPEPIVAGLGETYEVSWNTCKPFACGIVLHAAIDACLGARAAQQFDPGEIEKVALRVHPIVMQITANPAPRTGLEGKFSVAHCAAVALLDGAAGERQFSDARVRAADVTALRSRVEAAGDASLRRDQADVRIVLSGGRTVEQHIEHAIGTLENPLPDERLAAKFRDLAHGVLEPAVTAQLMERCWRLEDVEDFSVLARETARTQEGTRHGS
jgi:2-methylcitrate dehydratase PrpD